MLEGQAALRRSCRGRRQTAVVTATGYSISSNRQVSPTLPLPPVLHPGCQVTHSPFVWSTTAAGFPAPIITTRSIQTGISKWPLGSAELEGAKMGAHQGKRCQSRRKE